MDAPIFDRAAEPFPAPLGSLDAIHLASAVLIRATIPDLVVVSWPQRRARSGSRCWARPDLSQSPGEPMGFGRMAVRTCSGDQ